MIKELISDKKLDFKVIKVKDHSDDTWKDAADLIVKFVRENSLFNINHYIDLNRFNCLYSLQFFPC